MVESGFAFRTPESAVFTPTLHHAATPAEGAFCAESFSDPATKNQESGSAGSGCLKLIQATAEQAEALRLLDVRLQPVNGG